MPRKCQNAEIDLTDTGADDADCQLSLPVKIAIKRLPDLTNSELNKILPDLKIHMSMNNLYPGTETDYLDVGRLGKIIRDKSFHVKMLVENRNITIGPFGDEHLRKFQRYPDRIYMTIESNFDSTVFPKLAITPLLNAESHSHARIVSMSPQKLDDEHEKSESEETRILGKL